MSKVYIAYQSGTGNTEEIAEQFASYLEEAGAEVTTSRFDEADIEAMVASDKVALGCPASGSEELEDEFKEFFDEVKGQLEGKSVALFGSFGWGDGEYQNEWEDDAKDAGISVYGKFAQLEAIDDEGKENLKAFAEGFAK